MALKRGEQQNWMKIEAFKRKTLRRILILLMKEEDEELDTSVKYISYFLTRTLEVQKSEFVGSFTQKRTISI